MEVNPDSKQLNKHKFNYKPEARYNFYPGLGSRGASIKGSTDIGSSSKQDFDNSTAINTTGKFTRGIRKQQA